MHYQYSQQGHLVQTWGFPHSQITVASDYMFLTEQVPMVFIVSTLIICTIDISSLNSLSTIFVDWQIDRKTDMNKNRNLTVDQQTAWGNNPSVVLIMMGLLGCSGENNNTIVGMFY